MPVALFLNQEQMNVFNTAIKGKDIEYKTLGRSTIQLTAENWEAIRDAVQSLHQQKFKVRTKTIDHMETCYYAEEVLKKIRTLESDLRRLPPMNDNTVGIVETATDEEVKPELTEEWFDTAEKITPESTEKAPTNARSRK